LPPIRWIVPDLLPEGLTILAGKPKMGKSWLALALALAVASGTAVLGQGPLERGPVLYLALEDHERRLQRRLAQLLDDAPAPRLHELLTACPRLHEGGVAVLEKWLLRRAGARLLIVDTLAKVRTPTPPRTGIYEADYEALRDLKRLADAHAVALLLIHHLRKQPATDVFDQVSGSTGLTGAADSVLVLQRERGSSAAILHVSGRDVDERQVRLTFDRERARWLAAPHTALHPPDGPTQRTRRGGRRGPGPLTGATGDLARAGGGSRAHRAVEPIQHRGPPPPGSWCRTQAAQSDAGCGRGRRARAGPIHRPDG